MDLIWVSIFWLLVIGDQVTEKGFDLEDGVVEEQPQEQPQEKEEEEEEEKKEEDNKEEEEGNKEGHFGLPMIKNHLVLITEENK